MLSLVQHLICLPKIWATSIFMQMLNIYALIFITGSDQNWSSLPIWASCQVQSGKWFLCGVLQYKTYFCGSPLSLSLFFAMMAIVSSPTTARTGLLLCQVRISPLPSLVGLICTMIRTTYHVFVKLTLHVIQFFVWLSRTSSLLCDTMNSHAYQI